MMNLILNLAYAAAVFLSLLSVGWLLSRGNKNKTTLLFILCQGLIILWCLTQFFNVLPLDKWQKYIAYDICFLGICMIGPTWLLFSCFYSERKVTPGMALGLYLLPIFHYVMMLTNELHHLYYRIFQSDYTAYGPLFFTNAAYTYLCVFWGMAVIWRNLKKNPTSNLQVKAVLLSVCLPIAFNLLYLSGFINPGVDITPIAFSASSLLLLIATYRYNFLNVNTLASDRILEHIAEGVLIYNTAGRITYSNRLSETLLGTKKGDAVTSFYAAFESDHPAAAWEQEEPIHGLVTVIKGKTLEFHRYHYLDRKNRVIASIIMFSDVSRYYELLERTRELAVSNQQLAIEKERNRIAQEVHDTAGHTLTMIRSLAKLAETGYAGGSHEQMNDYLSQIRQLSGDGIRELRGSINNLKQISTCGLVAQGVLQLADSVKEMEIEVCLQGSDDIKYSHLSPVIYGCMREAITNSLKYAHASHMDIILKFHEDSLGFYLVDNGTGCAVITDGHGLTGMRERVAEASGSFHAASAPGEGFQIAIRLPVRP